MLRPSGDGWQSGNTYNPAAVVHDDRVVLLYRAHSDDRVSRIGYAVSDDGLHFEAEASPVLEPTEAYEQGGCEDPRLACIDGVFQLVMLVNGASFISREQGLVDYRCGQISFALDDPRRLVERTDEPWLAPSSPEERAGLVPNVTFVEGVVRFRGRWLAYYGQSDTTTAVAVADCG